MDGGVIRAAGAGRGVGAGAFEGVAVTEKAVRVATGWVPPKVTGMGSFPVRAFAAVADA